MMSEPEELDWGMGKKREQTQGIGSRFEVFGFKENRPALGYSLEFMQTSLSTNKSLSKP